MIDHKPQSDDAGIEVKPEVNGATDAQLLNVCKACGTSAPADSMGLCPNPKCRAVRKGAKLAAKHGPINTKRRKELLERFISDYRPTSMIDEVRCKQLASISERLEVVKAGSPDHVRLVQTSQILIASLEQSLSNRPVPTQVGAELRSMSDEQLLARLEELTERQRRRVQERDGQVPVGTESNEASSD